MKLFLGGGEGTGGVCGGGRIPIYKTNGGGALVALVAPSNSRRITFFFPLWSTS